MGRANLGERGGVSALLIVRTHIDLLGVVIMAHGASTGNTVCCEAAGEQSLYGAPKNPPCGGETGLQTMAEKMT
jgi:hypothetical protein